jgi:cystathionine gamma-lyase
VNEPGFRTRAIHAGQQPDPTTGAIMTPVYLTSTFVQSSPGVTKGYEYSRSGNPTRSAYEACLASLENGRHGFAFASGCAAATTCMHLLASGDHVIACDDIYGGSFRLFRDVFEKQGLTFTFMDMSNPQAVATAIRPETKMVWIETPSNPLMKLIDIAAVVGIANAHALLTVVDNTFMTPYFQQPLDLGADIVLHSTTKYIGGHSDLLGGALVVNDDALAERVEFLSNAIGAVGATFDAWLYLRSLKTLAVRMEAHERNARTIAAFLDGHRRVERVLYPGLESDPGHALAQRQMSGFGGMISFYVKGTLDDARRFLEKVRVFTLAESLGGVESLIEHPAIMTHASMPKGVRDALGVSDTLIRLSVGLEDVDDLIADLDQALTG